MKRLLMLLILLTQGEKTMATTDEAIFAMGCFWCGAAAFADHDTNVPFKGITSIRSGYTGGALSNPTYESHEGHVEAVKIVFDPSLITYEKLLDIFWHNVDPFDDYGQFCDKGMSYKAMLFYKDETQRIKAEKSKKDLEKKFGKPFVTNIKLASKFTDAEEYHQNYKAKNPVRYSFYKWNCGRAQRLEQVWGKP